MDIDLQKAVRNNQKFSQVYMYINNFGAYLELRWTFDDLEKMLMADVNSSLFDEFVKAILRIIRQIEPSYRGLSGLGGLDKYVELHSNIENPQKCVDFESLGTDDKLDLLLEVFYNGARAINETATAIKSRFVTPAELRWHPLGRDFFGVEYYYQEDIENNPRVYTAKGPDMRNPIWTLKTKTRQGIYKLIMNLQDEECTDEMLSSLAEITLTAREKKKYALRDGSHSYCSIYKHPDPQKLKTIKKPRRKWKSLVKKMIEEKENVPEQKEEVGTAQRLILKPIKKIHDTGGMQKEANLMSAWLKKTSKEERTLCKRCHEKGTMATMNACKGCDSYYHIGCVNSESKVKLWTCPKCTNKDLIYRLSMVYIRLANIIQHKMEKVYAERKMEVKSKYSLRKYGDLDKLQEDLLGEGSDVSEEDDEEEENYQEEEEEESDDESSESTAPSSDED